MKLRYRIYFFEKETDSGAQEEVDGMELALIEKIIALFLMLFAGFILVKKDILKKEDSQNQ